LEFTIRQRLLKNHPNVKIMENCTAKRLVVEDGKVVGLCYEDRSTSEEVTLYADLVIDCCGRAQGLTMKTLEEMSIPLPRTVEVTVNCGYSSRIYALPDDWREHHDFLSVFCPPEAPLEQKLSLIFPLEGQRIMAAAGCWHGDVVGYPPTDEQQWLKYIESCPINDAYKVIKDLKPLTALKPYRFKSSYRRMYEELTHFPEGLLVVGDAICGLNPLYGQGMMVSVLEAQCLYHVFSHHRSITKSDGNLSGIFREYFKSVSFILDPAWQRSVSSDLMFPETTINGSQLPRFVLSLFAKYAKGVYYVSQTDPKFQLKYWHDVVSYISPASVWLNPECVGKVIAWYVGLIKSDPIVTRPNKSK